MSKLSNIFISCIAIILLAGCFPSERMYVMEDCDSPTLCGVMPIGSEFAFVKQYEGSNYEIWINQQPGVVNGPMRILKDCEAPVEGNEFECDACGNSNSFKIVKLSGSDCGFAECIEIRMDDTVSCPGGGTGRGGSNED